MSNKKITLLLLLITTFFNIKTENNCYQKANIYEKHIVIVTASRNNIHIYKKNLDSIFNQKYNNYELIYIDDVSTDGTGDAVEKYIKERGQEHRVTLIRNTKRVYQLENQYKAIHSCNDNDIIIIVDGDDLLENDHVLSYINKIYSENPDIWLTYGQYTTPNGAKGIARDVPQHVITNNQFRKYGFVFSHLRTFYAWLYKEIKKEDLIFNWNFSQEHKGKFLITATDVATMFPMIEMARNGHFKFINDVLYVHIPRQDPSKFVSLNLKIYNLLRKKKPYNAIEEAPIS